MVLWLLFDLVGDRMVYAYMYIIRVECGTVKFRGLLELMGVGT